MKIKIIDLLVKIANGEEKTDVKTKYNSINWDEEDFFYSIYEEFGGKNNDEIVKFLNNKVEIIEEPKKIEKIKQLNNVANCKELTELEDKQQINNHILKDKINKLIDEINKLKENEHEI